ncbi:hypothetical protein AALP_AA8G412700 [Arabis alpina]|uniref:NYN domain-containing protein n=1 Tax=Arabis alpina TaxID=50452 RepID=A0A087GCR3_ARAAL|nr:hypothetical protein AALP_AA8G412700 [Arabis alpina]
MCLRFKRQRRRRPIKDTRQEEEASPPPPPPPSTQVIVDMDNGTIPRGTHPKAFFKNIRRYIYEVTGSLVHSIKIYYCKKANLHETYLYPIQVCDGVELINVPESLNPKREDGDIKIKYDFLFHQLTYLPPAPVCLLASDKDFIATMRRMMKQDYTILHGYDPNATPRKFQSLPGTMPFNFLQIGKLEANIDMPLHLGVCPPLRILPPAPLQNSNVNLRVFLDVHSTFANLPSETKRKRYLKDFHISPATIRLNVERIVTSQGYGGIKDNISSVALIETLTTENKNEMVDSRFTITMVNEPNRRKKKEGQDFVDVRVGQLMQQCLLDLEQLAPVVVITMDPNLDSVVEKFVEMGYPVFIVYSSRISSVLQPNSLPWKLVRKDELTKSMTSVPRKYWHAETAVFWDLEDCPIPSNLTASSVYANIVHALCHSGYGGTFHFSVYSLKDEEKFVRDVEQWFDRKLDSTNILIVPAASIRAKRKKIVEGILEWKSRHDNEPTNILVISREILFRCTPYLEALQLAKDSDNNILLGLAFEPRSSLSSLLGVSRSVWDWSKLSNGERPLVVETGNLELFYLPSHDTKCLNCAKLFRLPRKEAQTSIPESGQNKFCRAKTAVLWDLEDCPIPCDLTPSLIYANIKLALSNMGYTGEIFVSAYTLDKLDKEQEFESANIKLLQPGGGEKRVVLLNDAYRWASKFDPTNILLISKDISDDASFCTILKRTIDFGSNIQWAFPQAPTGSLLVPSAVWLWSSLSTGGSPHTGLSLSFEKQRKPFHIMRGKRRKKRYDRMLRRSAKRLKKREADEAASSEKRGRGRKRRSSTQADEAASSEKRGRGRKRRSSTQADEAASSKKRGRVRKRRSSAQADEAASSKKR